MAGAEEPRTKNNKLRNDSRVSGLGILVPKLHTWFYEWVACNFG